MYSNAFAYDDIPSFVEGSEAGDAGDEADPEREFYARPPKDNGYTESDFCDCRVRQPYWHTASGRARGLVEGTRTLGGVRGRGCGDAVTDRNLFDCFLAFMVEFPFVCSRLLVLNAPFLRLVLLSSSVCVFVGVPWHSFRDGVRGHLWMLQLHNIPVSGSVERI